jgi:cohesin loading factor subunit SCC2
MVCYTCAVTLSATNDRWQQVSSLDDVKFSNQTDNNAAKTIALDHLGVIAARIRSSVLNTKRNKSERLQPLDEASA